MRKEPNSARLRAASPIGAALVHRGRVVGRGHNRYGVVMLMPEQQRELIDAHPRAFVAAAGKWGESGSTVVTLREADAEIVAEAIRAAWLRRAPKPGKRGVVGS